MKKLMMTMALFGGMSLQLFGQSTVDADRYLDKDFFAGKTFYCLEQTGPSSPFTGIDPYDIDYDYIVRPIGHFNRHDSSDVRIHDYAIMVSGRGVKNWGGMSSNSPWKLKDEQGNTTYVNHYVKLPRSIMDRVSKDWYNVLSFERESYGSVYEYQLVAYSNSEIQFNVAAHMSAAVFVCRYSTFSI